MKLVHATSLHGEPDHLKSPVYFPSRRSFSAMITVSMHEGWSGVTSYMGPARKCPHNHWGSPEAWYRHLTGQGDGRAREHRHDGALRPQARDRTVQGSRGAALPVHQATELI